MVLESVIGPMEIVTKETGWTDCKTNSELTHTRTGGNTQVIGLMAKSMAMEYFYGLMVRNMKDNGKMAKWMDLVLLIG